MTGRHARHRAKTEARGGRVAALEYSTVFSALTLLGLFVFGALSAYYFAFYGQLGLTPSDVGLAQGEVLARAAYWLGTFLLAMVFLLAILGSFVLVVVESVRAVRRRLHRPPPRRLPELARRVRRFLPPAECWALAALVLVTGLIENEQPSPFLDAAILLVVFWPLAHVLGRTRRRRRLSVVVFSLLALGVFVFTLAQQGQQDAEHLEGTGSVRTMSQLMGIEHFYVSRSLPVKSLPAVTGRAGCWCCWAAATTTPTPSMTAPKGRSTASTPDRCPCTCWSRSRIRTIRRTPPSSPGCSAAEAFSACRHPGRAGRLPCRPVHLVPD